MRIPKRFTLGKIAHLALIFIPLVMFFMLAFFAQIVTAISRTCEKLLSKIAVQLMLNFEQGE